MKNVIEINKPIVDALRMSIPLPNVGEAKDGHLHILYGDQFKPVAYLVHRLWPTSICSTNYEHRYFTVQSLPGAIELLNTPRKELPEKTDEEMSSSRS